MLVWLRLKFTVFLKDMPIGLMHDIYELVTKIPERLDEMEDVITKNRIFLARTVGIGVSTAHEALNRGMT